MAVYGKENGIARRRLTHSCHCPMAWSRATRQHNGAGADFHGWVTDAARDRRWKSGPGGAARRHQSCANPHREHAARAAETILAVQSEKAASRTVGGQEM